MAAFTIDQRLTTHRGPAVRHPGPARRAVYRRRRLAVTALLVVLAFAAGILLATTILVTPAGGSLTDEAREAATVRTVAEPGDSLWHIAERIAPDEDPRVVVDALSAARGGDHLIPGEVVSWPPAGSR